MSAYELHEILDAITDVTGPSCMVANRVNDAKEELYNADTSVKAIREKLADAEAIAVEAEYRQKTIDLLKLAVEHATTLIGTEGEPAPATAHYSIPPHNIPSDVYPRSYEEYLGKTAEASI